MKQFNLAEYKRLKDQGKEPKLITRDGRNARIICTDRKGVQPIIALINDDNEELEITDVYLEDGRSVGSTFDSENDLFFAPTKHKGWVNVFFEGDTRFCGRVYSTEAEAKEEGADKVRYGTTVPIEWED